MLNDMLAIGTGTDDVDVNSYTGLSVVHVALGSVHTIILEDLSVNV